MNLTWPALPCLLLPVTLAAAEDGYRLDPDSPIYQTGPSPLLDLHDEVTLEAWVKADPMGQAGGRMLERSALGGPAAPRLPSPPAQSTETSGTSTVHVGNRWQSPHPAKPSRRSSPGWSMAAQDPDRPSRVSSCKRLASRSFVRVDLNGLATGRASWRHLHGAAGRATPARGERRAGRTCPLRRQPCCRRHSQPLAEDRSNAPGATRHDLNRVPNARNPAAGNLQLPTCRDEVLDRHERGIDADQRRVAQRPEQADGVKIARPPSWTLPIDQPQPTRGLNDVATVQVAMEQPDILSDGFQHPGTLRPSRQETKCSHDIWTGANSGGMIQDARGVREPGVQAPDVGVGKAPIEARSVLEGAANLFPDPQRPTRLAGSAKARAIVMLQDQTRIGVRRAVRQCDDLCRTEQRRASVAVELGFLGWAPL